MHPMVKPALRRGWRDLNTVQFGMAPAHAMVLGPMDTATGSFLDLLDGTRGLPHLREEGRKMGLPDGHVDGLVERLARSGLLDDSTGGGPAADALRRKKEVLDRLLPDLASLSLVAPEPGDAIKRLAARRSLRVQVRGAGRVGVILASLLAGAGVGEIDVRDIGRVEPWDVAPGGLPADSIGERREEAARRAVRRAAPGRPPRTSSKEKKENEEEKGAEKGAVRGLSLVILTPRDGLAVHAPDPAAAEALIASGTPHLYAGVVEGTGVVGPLVLPGDTGCAGCLDEGRADRDPTWPRLVAQWRSGQQRRVPACDLTLAAGVAGVAAGHALAFLDGELPSSAGARWEASVPGFDWHARPVWPHPACPCGTAEKGKGERASEDGGPHATMAGQQPYAARLSGTWRAHV
ncbi:MULTISPECIES: TOMM precursor leader peptide-binding protein [unclassified Streptomyces]|uniref:TOMM precursor leader peptide-binding protein n=1 Tax=unclassified Streptomyces TaxID=2593676 RepID=UPI002E816654|nr:TOMM precursor leader peptide-binding protein [Streptomyces sp. NBC_00589]WTI36421.1 TOMM precursor leader peptide-binding protein [Streptomyces sp. NBC_00775]WUB29904.1 TOMM precursor leader peptide-binding protein [Streptomyces sp. NBC_00589]